MSLTLTLCGLVFLRVAVEVLGLVLRGVPEGGGAGTGYVPGYALVYGELGSESSFKYVFIAVSCPLSTYTNKHMLDYQHIIQSYATTVESPFTDTLLKRTVLVKDSF